jgi:cobyrinic acid a,c-diamide synthase
MVTRYCAAWLIAAPASGQGKTTVTAGLARAYRRRGLRVRVFKTGPDFLDPMILERASGAPVHQLDLWMVGEDNCRALLHQAAGEADVLLVEGVMGLYDGNPSSADLARRFGIPVAAVIDARAMAQTFGALAHGLAHYGDIPFAGVIANRVASEGHVAMLRESLATDIPLLASLGTDAAAALPERHLGLVQARELGDIEVRLERLADALQGVPVPAAVAFEPNPDVNASVSASRRLDGVRIAVARDAAFSFLYPANLELLEALGASLRFFSPLADAALPEADALYLPGGYPELHAARLADNAAMRAAIAAFHVRGQPLFAECGGMMFLCEGLVDGSGARHRMCALLPGEVHMQPKLAALGLQEVTLPEGTLRGHTFHYSALQTAMAPIARGVARRHGSPGEAVYRLGRLTASYVHFYFPSNPDAATSLFLP